MTQEMDDLYIDVQKLERSIDDVKDMMDKALKVALRAAREEMILSMFDLLGRAMRDAPVEFGDLRGSGLILFGDAQMAHTEADGESVQLVRDKPVDISAFSFSNYLKEISGIVVFDREYATPQHENMEFEHPKGGKAKYLEDNVKKMNVKYAKNYALTLKRALHSQGAFK